MGAETKYSQENIVLVSGVKCKLYNYNVGMKMVNWRPVLDITNKLKEKGQGNVWLEHDSNQCDLKVQYQTLYFESCPARKYLSYCNFK